MSKLYWVPLFMEAVMLLTGAVAAMFGVNAVLDQRPEAAIVFMFVAMFTWRQAGQWNGSRRMWEAMR